MSEAREARRFPGWLAPLAIALALAAMVACSFAQRWSVLTLSPFPLGVDGYFYPVQLRALLETGGLQYPTSPLAFWLLAPFAAATDPITGSKLGAAFYGALIALPTYAVGTQLGRSRGAGLVAAAIATFSAGSMYLTIEFVKNSIGITVAMTALWLVLRALARVEGPALRRIALAALGVIATLLVHKLAAGIVVAIALPACVAEAVARGQLRGRRLLYVLVGGALAIALLLVVGLVAPRRLLSLDDARLVGELLSDDARWSLPALVTPRFVLTLGHEAVLAVVAAVLATVALVLERQTARGRWMLVGRVVGALGVLVALAGALIWHAAPAITGVALAAGGIAIHARASRIPASTRGARTTQLERRGVHLVPWIAIVLALVVGLPWLAVDDAQGLGMRLRVVAFVPLALCAATAMRLVRQLALVVARDRDVVAHRVRTVASGLLALAFALRVPGSRTEGLIAPHPAMVTAVHAASAHVPAGELITLPERHLAFMVAWYTRRPVSLRPHDDTRWRILPLALVGETTALGRALWSVRDRRDLPPVIGLHPRHPNGLVLVPEVTWRYLLARLPPSERRWSAI